MTRARTKTAYRLSLAAVLIAFSAVTAPAFAGKPDNAVRFAFDQTLDNIDPYFTITHIGNIVAENVWDTLVHRDPQTGAYTGDLATAWHRIDDRTLEFELRQGVRFHDGAEFDADDVVDTLNAMSNPTNKAVQLKLVRWIDHVEKRGKHEVRIIAKEPFPAAIAFLASPYAAIHPRSHYVNGRVKALNEMPVGTGPFRVVEYSLGKRLVMQRNELYFADSPKSKPKLNRIEIRFIPDAQTRVAEMASGSLDLIMSVGKDQAEQLRSLPNLQSLASETMRYAFLQIRSTPTATLPLRDVRVRQAIAYAIDRVTMAKFLLGDSARVLHSECYPDQFGCTEEGIPRYAYDPLKAKQLLSEAGYARGFDIDLYAARDRNQSEAIIGYLRAVGIRARLRFVQQGTLATARREGKASLLMSDSASAGVFDLASSTSNYHEFSPDWDVNRDPEIRDLLLRGDSSIDPDIRKGAYARALALVAERAYVLPLYSMPNYYLSARDLVFRAYADERPRFYEMSWK